MSDDVDKLRSALELYQQEDFTRAEMLIGSIFSEQLPDDLLVELHYLHGLILVRRNDLLEAAVKFQSCARLNDKFFPALDAWGNVLSRLGDFRGAMDKYRRAEEVCPADGVSHVLVNQGKVLIHAGYTFKALKRFHRASRLDPKSDDACYYAGICLLHLKRQRRARRWMQRAAELSPDSVRNMVGLGNALSAVSRYTKAEEIYRQALDLDNASVEAWYNLSLLYSAQKDFVNAIKTCKAGQKLNAGAYELLSQHLFCLRQMGAYDAALAMADEALRSVKRTDDFRRSDEFHDLLTANTAACERANGNQAAALEILLAHICASPSSVRHSLEELRWLQSLALPTARVYELTVSVVPTEGRAYQRTYWIVARNNKSAEKLMRTCEPEHAAVTVTDHSAPGRVRADVDGGVLERTPAIPLDT
ncbi:MAG: tetratricopeptide repeat protein [Planctomycetota bacterium]|jgi:tetratricopeptide (TPR) repeat protein